MKQPSLIMKIIMSVLLAGVLVYFGVYLFRSYQGGVTTVMAYADSVNTGLELTGVLVREESVLSSRAASGHLVSFVAAEGEKVSAGGPVATLYASAGGLNIQQDIRALEAEIEQLEYVLNSSGDAGDAARLDAEVLSAIASLRASAAAGDLSNLEDDTLQLRTLVFKRDYTFGDAAESDITALIEQKSNQLAALRASLGSSSTTVYTPQAGVFSSLVDGLEESLAPAILSWATPSQFLARLDQTPAVDDSAVGKLITSSTWYFAAVVPEAAAAGLRENHAYTVLFSHDWSGEPDMTLERVSDPEDGQVLLVFSCRTHLSDVTLLREQTAQVVVSTIEGLRIPRQALRSITRTVTNAEGVAEEKNVLGVYVLVGATSEFKEVTVLWQDADSFLVEAVVHSTSAQAEAERLQEDDEVIISTAGLYDGKVVR